MELPHLEDKWIGKYAEGLPSKNNREAKCEKNPQYGLTVNKAGKGFVVLRLAEKKSSSTSVQYGYINIQKIDGQLIVGPSKKVQLGSSGPVNAAVQSIELDFPSELSYPYTFSILVANMNTGAEGEGGFMVQAFSKDPSMKFTKLN